MSLKKRVFLSWLLVVFCVLSILLIVPIARTIRNFVELNWGVSLFGYFVLFFVICAFLVCLYLLWFRLRIRSVSNYIWLAAVAFVYVFFTLELWGRPEEAIHFLEYAILGYLLYRALAFHIHDKGIYFIAFMIGALVAIFDEGLQWMIPRRVWDFRDLGINALSVALFLIAIGRGIRPKLPPLHWRSSSIRILSYLLTAYLILFGLCFSNTPDRVERYTEVFPFLSFLQKEEAMNEFKYKHEDPEIGVFFSRLTIVELLEIDSKRAEEYGNIFKQWEEKPYQEFLNNFPGYSQPFLYEMRIHVFRRNRRFQLSNETENEKIQKQNLFIAYKENLILEKYFSNTLQKSPFLWPRKKIESIETKIDKTMFYKSPVSAGSPIPFNEKTLWGIILFLVASLIVLNILLSSEQKNS